MINSNFIFFSRHFLFLILLIIIFSCSNEKKQPEIYKTVIEYNIPRNNYFIQDDNSITKYINMYAVVNENNVHIYSNTDIDSETSGFLHKGNIVRVSKMKETEIIEQSTIDKYYFVHINGTDNLEDGWVYDKFINFIQIQQTKSIMLSNSKIVDTECFSKINHNGFGYTDYGFIYNYLDDTGDWVIYDGSVNSWGSHGISIHLKNLPSRFIVKVYTEDEQSYLQYLSQKKEVPIQDYEDDHDSNTKAILNRIKPFYYFYFPAQVTSVSSRRKVELFDFYNADSDVIFSTYITFPSIPFKRTNIDGRNIYLQFNTASPLYLVLYKDNKIIKEHEIYGTIVTYERTPVAAFSIYPEDDGNWEGLLSVGSEFDIDSNYNIYLFRINENQPDDYTQEITGFWDNNVHFNR
ncbi:MAG: hypothetical protein LBB72_04035 [Spirochaetaceae bacterium]|jgi:hypothetical protein|nr:hypothetical protein [Spirochaetaceae bacterium]